MTEGNVEHVWQLMRKIGFCFLASKEGQIIRGRPMAAHCAPEEGAIYFLTDAESHKDEEVERDPHVSLFFGDNSAHDYVAVTGHARISNDREKVRELWSTPAKAWWDDPEDPSIRVLAVTPEDAQYWDSPGRAISIVKMLAAATSSSRPDMGDNAKVRM